MRPEILIGLGSLIITVSGWLLWHIIKDHETQADLKARVSRLEQDIGTHESGIRGAIHKQGNLISRVQGALLFIAEKLKITIKRDDE